MKCQAYSLNLLTAFRRRLEAVEIRNSEMAKLVCKLIPSHCPFERTITLFGRAVHIPPLCKLNPLYDQLVELRFKALTYLADRSESTVHYI
ncbi:nitrogenase [Cyanobacteria bacterium FACHB-63]|nr:nitrogenase [Cyanobacteria bacterium FACHB-63]